LFNGSWITNPKPVVTNEANRMVYLFELYEKYTADLFTKDKPKNKKVEKQVEVKGAVKN